MKWPHRKDRQDQQNKDEADESVAPKHDVLAGYETASMSMDFADEVEQRRRDAKDPLAPSGPPAPDQPDNHGHASEDH
ncbi:MAG TPA: hypothetical protein VGW98_02365 [Solirubrobacteraceae bacterium]|jgi:hypothetical protein|nr:hypothetical protein [Solirubrobacteraceae bacterium]